MKLAFYVYVRNNDSNGEHFIESVTSFRHVGVDLYTLYSDSNLKLGYNHIFLFRV